MSAVTLTGARPVELPATLPPLGISPVDAEAASVLKGIMCPQKVNSNAPLALSGHDLLDSLATVALLEPQSQTLPSTKGSLQVLNGRAERGRPRSSSDSDTLLQNASKNEAEREPGTSSPASVTDTSGTPLSAVLPHMMAKYAGVYNKYGRIGIYTPEERRAILRRFHEKRLRRVWSKKIRYNCRKTLADKRIRVKGRFVKKEELETMLAEEGDTSSASSDSSSSSRKRGRSGASSQPSNPQPKMKKAASAENAAASEERNAGTSSRQRRGLRIEASSKSGAPVEEDDNRPRTRFRRHSIAF
uniref:CCT domain-containing protein n=1 Tax=Pinguiococcus pyrenoidosus TaxID=172671 RepID=A0A7R9YCS0_9STRA|mmetsp:Transcript_2058/g.9059  ORF Transcript_2058/g.9059 Transcript_2058/m.9059 type:complete len:302 (+) Transcript_2058:285-1190(+)